MDLGHLRVAGPPTDRRARWRGYINEQVRGRWAADAAGCRCRLHLLPSRYRGTEGLYGPELRQHLIRGRPLRDRPGFRESDRGLDHRPCPRHQLRQYDLCYCPDA